MNSISIFKITKINQVSYEPRSYECNLCNCVCSTPTNKIFHEISLPTRNGERNLAPQMNCRAKFCFPKRNLELA